MQSKLYESKLNDGVCVEPTDGHPEESAEID